MSGRRLIVNADDFGLTPGVSAGILAAHRHGIVTSTTALVNGPVPPRARDELLDSGLGVGLHVNLTLGAPLTSAPSLVDRAGRFIRDARQAAARARPAEVRAEVAAQVDAFDRLFGRRPTHLDSHHHVALYTPVREIVLEVAVALKLPVRSQDAAARARARSAGLRSPDHFFGESGPGAYWTPARTLVRLRALPPGLSEFMAHPGYVDDALSYSRYARQREVEMAGLGAGARAAAAALGIELCDFRALR